MSLFYRAVAIIVAMIGFASEGFAKSPRAFVMPEPMAASDSSQDRVVQVRADEPLVAPTPDGAPEAIEPGQSDPASVGGYSTGGASCCGSCNSCSCCGCGYPPAFTLRVGTMILAREHSQDLVSLGTGYGYEIDAIRHGIGGSCTDIEARYFGVYGYNAQVPFFFPIAVTSQLQNAEFNLRRHVNSWLQLLGGFRWIELEDTAISGGALATNTTNRLFGGQIGADVAVWQYHRLSFDAIGKAGVYGNAASLGSTGSFPPLTANPAVSRGQTAFVGEIGLTTRYKICRNLAARATYELLWLDGVAAISEQNQINVLTTNTMFYQGGFIGLELTH